MATEALALVLADGAAWERLPGEPIRWYARFSRYFLSQEMSSRSLIAAYRAWRIAEGPTGRPFKHDTPPDRWMEMASAWHWVERAARRDVVELERQRRQDESEKQAMLARQRAAGRKLQELAIRRLIEIEANLSLLNATEARKYLSEGAVLEREARGLPGSVVQTNVGMVMTPQVGLADFDWRAAVGLPEEDGTTPEQPDPQEE